MPDIKKETPEGSVRKVVDACSDCDICRFLMDGSCLVFPELYRLWDKEMETGKRISAGELRALVDLCNFCALCPCPNIRSDLMAAKSSFIERDGLKPQIRIVEDVALLSRICGSFPQISRRLLKNPTCGGLVKQALGIHAKRKLPAFPPENFPTWAKRHNLHIEPQASGHHKVAYFAGCTANYLFPKVAKAAVEVLRSNDIDVWCPPLQCCGMPTFLEGDRKLTQNFIRSNMAQLGVVVEKGYEIVCSCPTCGFFLKTLLKEGAYYSAEYQASIKSENGVIMVPDESSREAKSRKKFIKLQKSIYQKILIDGGHFTYIPPLQRIQVAEHTTDLGELLLKRYRANRLTPLSVPRLQRLVYFQPCHQREQNVGQPYLELLHMISGLSIEAIDGNLYCCGMAGIMGFKHEFHEESIQIGQPLMDRIERISPDGIVTDCLSCRLQFRHTTRFPVYHPLEIIQEGSIKSLPLI